MARDPISSNSQSAVIGQIAANFANTATHLAQNSAGMFDRFIEYQNNQKKEAMQEEEFKLRKEATQSQIANEKMKNELLNKQVASYDADKALQKRQIESEMDARKAAAALNYANTKNIKQNIQEKEDLKKLQATPYNPLPKHMHIKYVHVC